MQPEEIVRRGQEATELLRHPLIQEFFESYPRQLFDRMMAQKDSETREEVYRLITLKDLFRNHLAQIIGSGKLEEKRLEDATE